MGPFPVSFPRWLSGCILHARAFWIRHKPFDPMCKAALECTRDWQDLHKSCISGWKEWKVGAARACVNSIIVYGALRHWDTHTALGSCEVGNILGRALQHRHTITVTVLNVKMTFDWNCRDFELLGWMVHVSCKLRCSLLHQFDVRLNYVALQKKALNLLTFYGPMLGFKG